MKYDAVAVPIGSIIRAQAQLAKLDLLKALKTCRIGNIPIDAVRPDLENCLRRLFSQRSFGVILSAYYTYGVVGTYSVEHLLRELYKNRDFPTLLKQAYRFDFYSDLIPEIDDAIKWHRAKGRNDGAAWERKFTKLREQEVMRTGIPHSILHIEDEPSSNVGAAPKVFELRPLMAPATQNSFIETSIFEDDPYIISRTARAKMEQANASHRSTLHSLRVHLEGQQIAVSESKLIDAYAILEDGPAIFEIKSINEDNERDQIRHALSQLYEYRFLHSMESASLWIVFSQAPSSQWYIDYLSGDRGIRIVWLCDGQLSGPSSNRLRRAH